jgi:hypothetical protein
MVVMMAMARGNQIARIAQREYSANAKYPNLPLSRIVVIDLSFFAN